MLLEYVEKGNSNAFDRVGKGGVLSARKSGRGHVNELEIVYI